MRTFACPASGAEWRSAPRLWIAVTVPRMKSTISLVGAPGTVVSIMGLLKIVVAVSIIFSALAARLVLQGLTSDKVTRMVIK